MRTSSLSHHSSELLEVDAEVKRLGKLLGLDHAELAYLRALPSAEIHALRDQVTVLLFDNQAVLARLASATRIMPAAVTAGIAEKVFGPMLAGRIAGLVDADRAVDIASRLPTAFLADVAIELDPRRVASILAEVPPAMIADVTELLMAREEWVSMGSFLGFLPKPAIAAAMTRMDTRALLHVALVLDDKPRLPAVFELASPAVLGEISSVAEAEGLSEQLQALSAYLTPEQQARLQG